MTVALYHSTAPDGTDTTKLRPSNWNAVSDLLEDLFGSGLDGETLTVSAPIGSGGGTQSGSLSMISDAGSPYGRFVLSANATGSPNLQLLARAAGAHIGFNLGNTSASAAVVMKDGSGDGYVGVGGAGYQSGSDLNQFGSVKHDSNGLFLSSLKSKVRIDGLIQFGGTAATKPALKQNGTDLEVRKADDSGYAILKAFAYNVSDGAAMIYSSVNFTNGAGVSTGTLTNAPAAGNPSKYLIVSDNGVLRAIPSWIIP